MGSQNVSSSQGVTYSTTPIEISDGKTAKLAITIGDETFDVEISGFTDDSPASMQEVVEKIQGLVSEIANQQVEDTATYEFPHTATNLSQVSKKDLSGNFQKLDTISEIGHNTLGSQEGSKRRRRPQSGETMETQRQQNLATSLLATVKKKEKPPVLDGGDTPVRSSQVVKTSQVDNREIQTVNTERPSSVVVSGLSDTGGNVPTPPSFDLAAAEQKIGAYDLRPEIRGENRRVIKGEEGCKRALQALNPEARKELLAGCNGVDPATGEEISSVEEKKSDRKAFLAKLKERLDSYTPPAEGEKRPTTMEEFLGDSELVDLYKAAVKEESESVAFREAVFTKSSERTMTSPCRAKKVVMFVGGPSAAGKSFARGALLNAVAEQNNKLDNYQGAIGENYVVSVDGGIEREVCQMRQMILQASLSKGFTGISDLHENSKTGVKSKVMNAAMKQDNTMHVVIPETFADPRGFNKHMNMVKKQAKNRQDIQHVFAEVRADKTEGRSKTGREGKKKLAEARHRFRKAVAINGNTRAYMSSEATYSGGINMNNRKIGCESKKYGGKHFKTGVRATSLAKKRFKSIASDGALVVSLNSDDTHVSKDANGNWVESLDSFQTPDIPHIAKRELDLWNNLKNADNSASQKEILRDYMVENGHDAKLELWDNLESADTPASQKAALKEYFEEIGHDAGEIDQESLDSADPRKMLSGDGIGDLEVFFSKLSAQEMRIKQKVDVFAVGTGKIDTSSHASSASRRGTLQRSSPRFSTSFTEEASINNPKRSFFRKKPKGNRMNTIDE